MDTASVEDLVDRARRGDRDAFSAIYEGFAPRVLRYLHHEVGDPDVAEELTQRTFLKMIESLPQFESRPGVPFAAWLFRVARNAAIDERRRVHPGQIDPDAEFAIEGAGPSEIAEAHLERHALLAALERLPADHHDVLVYRFFAEMSPREVAAVMGRSQGAVRVLQHRALAALRRSLVAHPELSPRASSDEVRR